jgi:hypothetical protein
MFCKAGSQKPMLLVYLLGLLFCLVPEDELSKTNTNAAHRASRCKVTLRAIVSNRYVDDAPQWSGQKRPTVVRSKPANGRGPGLDSFNPASLDPASRFLFSSSVVRISGCDRGVAVGRA